MGKRQASDAKKKRNLELDRETRGWGARRRRVRRNRVLGRYGEGPRGGPFHFPRTPPTGAGVALFWCMRALSSGGLRGEGVDVTGRVWATNGGFGWVTRRPRAAPSLAAWPPSWATRRRPNSAGWNPDWKEAGRRTWAAPSPSCEMETHVLTRGLWLVSTVNPKYVGVGIASSLLQVFGSKLRESRPRQSPAIHLRQRPRNKDTPAAPPPRLVPFGSFCYSQTLARLHRGHGSRLSCNSGIQE